LIFIFNLNIIKTLKRRLYSNAVKLNKKNTGSVGTVPKSWRFPKSNRKNVERDKIDSPTTDI